MHNQPLRSARDLVMLLNIKAMASTSLALTRHLLARTSSFNSSTLASRSLQQNLNIRHYKSKA